MAFQILVPEKKSISPTNRKREPFSVSYGSTFAKILSSENLYVQVQDTIDTAFIDLQSKTIFVPDWDVEPDTFNFLLTHEVSHAIWTDCELWLKTIKSKPEKDQQLFQSILNIVEDCRIDRLVQRKYPGTQKWYIKGITDIMVEKDFFRMKDPTAKPLQERSLPDLINTYFKTSPLDNPFNVQFKAKDEAIVQEIRDVQTFPQVIDIAERLFEQFKEEEKELYAQSQKLMGFSVVKQGKDGKFYDVNGREVKGIKMDVDPNSELGKELEKIITGSTPIDVQSKANKSERMTPSYNYNKKYLYMKDPTNWRDFIVPLSQVLKNRSRDSKLAATNRDYVNYMASVFERKMKARDMARIYEVQKGQLDMNALHKYMFDDKIFSKNVITHDNKNHGFIMVVDCSGSMSGIFSSVMQYTYKLTQFCQRLRVPYKVFGFSDIYGKAETIKDTHFAQGKFGMIEFFSSEFTLQKNRENLEILTQFSDLGGTPLSTSVNYVKKIGEEMKARYAIDVLNCIFLTDGGCTCGNVYDYIVDERTRITHTTTRKDGSRGDNTPALYEILRQRLGCNVFNFDITHNTKIEILEEYNGTTATFKVNQNLFSSASNSNMFIEKMIETMSKVKRKVI